MNPSYILTSESVAEGHPDKIADQISDAILDAILAKDPHGRVACETFLKTGFVLVGGEITTSAEVDIEQIIRTTIQKIGYNDSKMGFDWESCGVLISIGKQSPDIACGINQKNREEQGAGDQGTVFGYACNETKALMPAPITFAHRLMEKFSEVRKSKKISWLRPDGKAQVSFKYFDGVPTEIDAIVVSVQHEPEVDNKELKEGVMEEIIKPVIPYKFINPNTRFFINPTGRFVIGGPQCDCGMTGRKIIVDTYGGASKHGGGSFSGKDPSKIDRSGAYIARYIAKNLVAAGLADKCEVEISYAIGIAEPISINIETFGTGRMDEGSMLKLVRNHLDLRPNGIIKTLDLLNPIYSKTATFGHFGREELGFSWEKRDLAKKLALSNGEC